MIIALFIITIVFMAPILLVFGIFYVLVVMSFMDPNWPKALRRKLNSFYDICFLK